MSPGIASALVPVRTGDGSFTLRSERLGAFYHSMHGAVQESVHVFIQAGLAHWSRSHPAADRPVDVLEVGLGTGLNMLLTWIRCMEGKGAVRYTALEPDPLSREQLMELAYWDELAWPALKEPFLQMMTAGDEVMLQREDFQFRSLRLPVLSFQAEAAFDVIYFDAFAPSAQPEMWTPEVFRSMYAALRPGGVLVTFCAKGEVRRTMQQAGFNVDRIQGPPGKRQMIRATRPAV
jgi:tRNA U34 5-methylaminomethyl-2-thiouridine-forming methyltransferase MnmC